MNRLPKVFVSRRIIGLENYADRLDFEVWEGDLPPTAPQLWGRVRGCDGLISMLTDKIDANFFDAVQGAPVKLRVISQYAVGVDNINLVAAKALGIPVGHTPGVLTDSTADLAFTLMLSAARNIAPGAEYVKAGRWQTWETTLLLGQPIWEATLGIIGFGGIGQGLAERSRGFRMRVLVTQPSLSQSEASNKGVVKVDLERLLRESDFISIHTPLTPQTRGLIGRRELALMKPTAVLVNTARGPIIDTAALAEALRSGRPGYAALDVTDPEPLPADHELLALPNCLVIPHLGSATAQARLAMTDIAMANLEAGLRGEPLPRRANP